MADCVEKVGVQTSWDSDEACPVEVGSEVRCAFQTFSGSLGHLTPCWKDTGATVKGAAQVNARGSVVYDPIFGGGGGGCGTGRFGYAGADQVLRLTAPTTAALTDPSATCPF